MLNIYNYINVIQFIYIDININNNKEYYSYFLKTVNTIYNIALKNNNIEEFINNDDQNEKITKYDNKRLGYKPIKGESQWTRICQN